LRPSSNNIATPAWFAGREWQRNGYHPLGSGHALDVVEATLNPILKSLRRAITEIGF